MMRKSIEGEYGEDEDVVIECDRVRNIVNSQSKSEELITVFELKKQFQIKQSNSKNKNKN